MKGILTLYLLTTLLFATSVANAQLPPSWNWVQQIGGTGLDRGILTVSDATGNVYQTGAFAGTVQVGATTLTSTSRDMYLVKYNATGTIQWIRQSQVQNNASSFGKAEGISITTDPLGNVYVSGNFAGIATFGTTTLTATTGSSNTFIVKFSAQGNIVWALNSNGSTSSSTIDASGLTANANGDVFASGTFSGSVTFGGLSALGQGGLDVFLVKINTLGIPQWVQSAGGNSTDYASSLAAGPNGAVYLSGGFSTTATFSALTVTSQGATDAFIALYDAQGTPQWVKRYGGQGSDGAGALVVAPNGEIYNVGFFNNTASFDALPLVSFGLDDGYVMKCNSQGVTLWARQVGGPGADEAFGVSLSSTGIPYVVGSFSGTAFFDGQTRTSAGGADVFIARYTSTGGLTWVDRCGGTGNEYDAGVTCGVNGTIYIGGQFAVTAQFGSLSLTSHGLTDGFIASLQDNVPTATTAQKFTSEYNLYPNPTKANIITLMVPNATPEKGTIDIFDVSGRAVQTILVQENQFFGHKIMVEIFQLMPGRYFMRYTTSSTTVSKPFFVI